MNSQNFVLEAYQLRKLFQQGSQVIEILDQLTLQVRTGERIAILGASGSGKSTLLHCLGGLERPTAGQVMWSGEEITQLNEIKRSHYRNQQLGFVYQFHHLLAEFNTLENVALPLLIQGFKPAHARARASALLMQVGLDQRLTHKPSALSGGERQRAALARALVTSPKCVLADEPTGNLDRNTARDIQKLLLALNQQTQVAFVVVTHDQELAAQMERCYWLEHGQLRDITSTHS
jgi:lipoprotein-releasing system ATP-binding protein